ncbi:hypothetical protein PDESU_02908 [Pontiella desulfatans]|uniref:Uncharacterized protein n=1 Tax=Pontiella desulfatans TaxID=2750659 RepID=A0A6C2U2W6_PONDE|nr:hypothetical protein [Pontiella desulfatans]VGO14348.1 hypothetical protein PDESU_02908 [Pontiella desulfatans]
MLALLISVAFSVTCIIACITTNVSTGGTIAAGIAGFFAPHFIIGYFVRKRTEAVKKELEELVLDGQKRINRKVQQFQSKPGGNIKLIQRQIESDQKEISKKSLEFIDRFETFKKWNLLMDRQIATMRLQFLYQLKEFDEVDKLIASGGLFTGPLMMEPMQVAMKMARQFKNEDSEGVEKTFNRRLKWFRGSRATLLYGVMTWVYMKEGKTEEARQLLNKAMESTGNEAFARNWEQLSNHNVKKFSNAGLGEEWFALYLENPPMPKQQRMRGNAQGRRF